MNNKLFFILTFLLIANYSTFSQEFQTLGSIGFDVSELNNLNKNAKSNDTLELPFIEDFSTSFPFQNSDLWEDTNVLINRTASISPPSIGCAIFDATDFEGNYYTTSYNSSHQADFLTSKPINLYYPDDNSIFFSFFYQAQGIMDKPEEQDSLILQFYSPQTEEWENIWFALGNSQQDFQQEIIQINEEKYLQKGFKFRFLNWASLGTSSNPSLVSNCDFWFVDYIRLDINRSNNDLVINELAFQYPPTFKIDEYEMIPYEHYKSQPAKNNFIHSYNLKYRNNDDIVRSIDSVYILFEEQQNRVETTKLLCGSFNTNPLTSGFLKKDDIANFSFPITDNYLLNYNVEAVLITNTEDSVFNNKASINKPLSGYYAYDDGTAEGGWGVFGDGANLATVATKFHSYKEDTLTGIQFYINKTFNDEQPNYFNLMVWNEDENGFPGEIIFEDEGIAIQKDYLNKFCTYYFDTIFTVSENFFVGWRNITNDLLNVGLDLNTTSNHKYFNIYGYWQESAIDGEILMRPVFGNSEYLPVKEIKTIDIEVFPNPASNFVNVSTNLNNYQLNIYDIYGRLIYTEENFFDNKIFVNDFSDGIYIMQIVSPEKQIINKKFIVKH